MKITIDIKTCSQADIKTLGSAVYAQHPTTEIICIALKPENCEPVLWIASPVLRQTVQGISAEELVRILDNADTVEGYGIQHEFFLWRYLLVPQYGFPMLNEQKLRCITAKAAGCGLPCNFHLLCQITGVEPRKVASGNSLEVLCESAKESVCLEEAISSRLSELSERELAAWRFGLKVNSRGYTIDVAKIRKILALIEKYSAGQREEFQALTGLKHPSQKEAFLHFCTSHGILLEESKHRNLSLPIDMKVKRALAIQQNHLRKIAAKYERLLEIKCLDDRIRGTFSYFGQHTGTWGERLITLDSPRPVGGIPAQLLRHLKSTVVPQQHHELIFVEYPDLDGRILAWLTGDERALIPYRQDYDLYTVTASTILNSVYGAITPKERIIGRIAEHAFRYQGSAADFKRQAAKENINLPTAMIEEFIKRWRNSRSRVVQFWTELELLCYQAFCTPQKSFQCRGVRIDYDDDFLKLHLPSDRPLPYFAVTKDSSSMMWTHKRLLSAFSMNTRRWTKRTLYGEVLTSDAVHAIARDLLTDRMLAAEDAGYPIIRIHDSGFLIERPQNNGSPEELRIILNILPEWAYQFPIKVTITKGETFQ